MTVLSKFEIAQLTPGERMALIDDLWESLESPRVAAATGRTQLTEWQCEVLNQRLLDLKNFPSDAVSLSDARRQSLL